MHLLVHLAGPDRGRRVPLRRRLTEAGSDVACTLWLRAEDIAPVHARFLAGGDTLRVERTAPGHLLRVNGEDVAEAGLRSGDRVEIGSAVFRYRFLTPAQRAVRLAAVPALLLLLVAAAAAAGRAWWQAVRHNARTARRGPPPAAPQAARPPPVDAPALDRMDDLSLRTPGPDTGPGEAPEDDPQAERRARARRILDAAERDARAGRTGEALARLAALQKAVPGFLPAYAARARLLETAGRPAEAEPLWVALLQAAGDDPLAVEAADALTRLALLRVPGPPAPGPAAEPPAAPRDAPPGGRLRLAGLDLVRFPESQAYAEMRVLRIRLEAPPDQPPPRPGEVRIDVAFYDQGERTRRVVRSSVRPPPVRVGTGAWTPGDERAASAAYVVPPGLREAERRERGERFAFYGYRVEVFYGGALQAASVRPDDLPAAPVTPGTP